jgi:uncharacterized protein (TIGR02646 family)
MLKLPNNPLPDIANARLQRWQNEINGLATYDLKVQEAKKQFPKKRQLKTFKTVVKTLSLGLPGVERCAYCEDSFGNQVEHIAPKEFYPERVFEFDNFLMACNPCNSQKWTKYAVFEEETGRTAHLNRTDDQPLIPPPAGDHVLINPRYEAASDFLELDLFGTAEFLVKDGLNVKDQLRADYTLTLLKLNKPMLVRARKTAIETFIALLQRYDQMKQNLRPEHELQRVRVGLLESPHENQP